MCFEDRIERCCLELAAMLEDLNNQLKKKVEQQLAKAVDNLLGYIRYQFYEPNGFKWGRVTKDHPAFPRCACLCFYLLPIRIHLHAYSTCIYVLYVGIYLFLFHCYILLTGCCRLTGNSISDISV